MATTLGELVTMVRSEAGHSLLASQGINNLDTIKYIINRVEEELFNGFLWPTLIVRKNFTLANGQFAYPYDAALPFDEIREVWWARPNSNNWVPVGYGIPEFYIKPDGTNSTQGGSIELWDVFDEGSFRVWPTPTETSYIRMKGMRPRNRMVAESDICTLDPYLICLYVSAEILTRAKTADAQQKQQKAERYLQQLLGDKVSLKNKVSTMGATRNARPNVRPWIDYIPY